MVVLSFKKTTFSFRWLFGIPLSILLFFIGYQITYFNTELNAHNHFQKYLSEENNTVIGLVTDYSEKANYHRITLAVQQIRPSVDSIFTTTGNLLVYIKKDSSQSIPPQYGDIIVLNSRIQDIEPPKNPDAFDFKQYWHFQNIHFQCFTDFNSTKILAHDKGNIIMATALSWRSYYISILKQRLDTENEYAVGAALLLGNRDAVTDEIRNAYIETGAMHILAISGMHILLVFSKLEWLLNLYKSGSRRWLWIKATFLIFFVILFTLVTGLGTSIVRAGVMSIIATIGRTMKRPVSPFNILAASAWLLLLWNPYWLMDVGFQLSYAAVAGIHLFSDKIQKLFASKYKFINKAWANVSLGIAAQIAVTPISLYYFHQFPVYFWLTGLLAGLVADAAVLLGMLLLIFNSVSIIGWSLGKILFCALWLLNNIIFLIQKLPFTLIEGFWLSLSSLALIYIAIIGFIYAFEKRQLRLMLYPLSITAFLCCLYAFSEVQNMSKSEAVVYYLPRNTLIDVFVDKKCYSFSKKNSANISIENKIKLAADNHRKSLNISNLNKLNFNEYVFNAHIAYQSGYMRLGDHNMLILDRLPKTVLPLSNCFVVVNGNPKFNIPDLMRFVSIRQVIFDGSNSRKRIEKWKKECQSLGVAYHDVSEKGAWIFNF